MTGLCDRLKGVGVCLTAAYINTAVRTAGNATGLRRTAVPDCKRAEDYNRAIICRFVAIQCMTVQIQDDGLSLRDQQCGVAFFRNGIRRKHEGQGTALHST